MNWLKENWFKVSIILILLVTIAVFTFLYRFTFLNDPRAGSYTCDKFSGHCRYQPPNTD